MKKFNWKLQKILDIKQMQENALKAELMSLSQKEFGLRSEAMLINTQMRSLIADLKAVPINERLERQAGLIEYTDTIKYQIGCIEKKIKTIIEQKDGTKKQLLEIRKLRKGLEILRDKARDEYIAEQEKILQSELDECASIATARKMIYESVA